MYSLLSDSKTAVDLNTVLMLADGRILVGSISRGVQLFDEKTKEFMPFLEKDQEGRPLYVRQLLEDGDGLVWIGSETGIFVCDTEGNLKKHLKHRYGDSYSLSDNAVHSLYEDVDGGIWAGTYFGGLNYISKNSQFQNFYPIPGENSISGKSISQFCQDRSGKIWIGTEDAGLNSFDPVTQTFETTAIKAKNIHALMAEDNRLWVGTFGDGLYRLNTKTGQYRHWRASDAPGGLTSDNIYSIIRDRDETLWIGTADGLLRYEDESFVRELEGEMKSQVIDIIQDNRGRIWVATVEKGIYCRNCLSGEWKRYPLTDLSSGKGGGVNCLLEDAYGRIWAGTDGRGVLLFDRASDSFATCFYGEKDLPNNVIYALVCDGDSAIWGSTNKGIFRIDPDKMNVTVYTKDNGLLCDQFNYKSGFMSREGVMYLGGIKGFVAFEPDKMNLGQNASRVVFDRIVVNGKKVMASDKSQTILSKTLNATESLKLPSNVRSFSLDLVEVNYDSDHKNVYRYILEGWDKEWIPTDLPATLTYSNLDSGKYTFMIKGDSSDEIISLDIRLMPPFYMTGWAYLCYLLIVALTGVVILYFSRKSTQEKEKRRREKMEAERDKEIFGAKIDFFSNVTHELRTPLTLIKIPLEEIIKNSGKDDVNYGNLLIMRDNADRLLNLTNQLLSFKKLNSNEQQPLFVRTDVAKIVRNVLSRFSPTIRHKKFSLLSDIPESQVADVDIEMFVKMTSNLMFNAIKHAADEIRMSMTVEAGELVLSVSNDGDVISDEYAGRIFEPFYKIDENSDGFGIGLPFIKRLAEVHKGRIELVRTVPGHTCFEVHLPLVQQSTLSVKSDELNYIIPEKKSDVPTKAKKTLLIIDDDRPFLDFMMGQLEFKYNVIKLDNAVDAKELLETKYVDAVVSDVVMPKMSGIELCRYIKEEKRLRNIPVILLTNEVDLQSKLDGLSAGADAYVEKPFYVEYLISCLENLFKSGYIPDESKHSPEVNTENLAYTKADEKFIELLTSAIYDNIEDVELDVNKLASFMNMSRATLYRRVKESLKVTPNDFIRVVRLKKAAELLYQKEYRINEIAFIVGFSSSSYFSKCFFKQYGVLPKDFVR